MSKIYLDVKVVCNYLDAKILMVMPMRLNPDLLITALAPVIWGTTYYVTTEFLPDNYPITVAMLRALPAGLFLLMCIRKLPQFSFLPKVLILGALNFSLFWWLLFESAYRLPGDVAATVGAVQPLIVIALSRVWLNSKVHGVVIFSAVVGMVGVGLLILTPAAKLNSVGILAALAGALSMAMGTVLSRRWQPEVSSLTFTAWQLMAGGLLLLPAALLFEPALPALSSMNLLGFVYLGTFGAALSYLFWFWGIKTLSPNAISTLGFLSPVVAIVIGWACLNQTLSQLQIFAICLVVFSIWSTQQAPLVTQLIRIISKRYQSLIASNKSIH